MTTSPFLRSFLFPGQKPAVVFIGKKLHGKEHEGASATDRTIVRLRPLLIHVGVTDDRIQHFQQVQQASMKGSVSDGVQNREKKIQKSSSAVGNRSSDSIGNGSSTFGGNGPTLHSPSKSSSEGEIMLSDSTTRSPTWQQATVAAHLQNVQVFVEGILRENLTGCS